MSWATPHTFTAGEELTAATLNAQIRDFWNAVFRCFGALTIFVAMWRKSWWLIGIGVAYFLFYLGGSYSFRYTHVCTRSHRKPVIEQTQNALNTHVIVVCDRYSGNAKRWSFGDPVRAVSSEGLNKWEGMGIGLIVVVIGAAAFFELRRRKEEARERALGISGLPRW